MSRMGLIACHDCDLLQRETALPPGGTARCRRCGAELYRSRHASIDRTLAWALAATVFLFVANTFPILGLKVGGTIVQTTLSGAGVLLYRDGMWPVSALVLTTTILMPALQILAILYLLVPLKLKLAPPRRHLAYRVLQLARPWSMTEVLLVGILVALVKLVHIASVVPAVGLWAFGAAMISLAAMAASFDPRTVWRHQDIPDAWPGPSAPCAARAGLFTCHQCGLLSAPLAHAHEGDCPRCGARVHFRKPDSIARTWALLVAAMALYIPANLLPMMYTSSLFGAQHDTIMSGVVYLWISGSWPLAIVVFIASVAVPMLKILALMFLVISVQLHARGMLQRNTRIYRLLEFVGPWSMLDIYVIAMLVALVQFSALATIRAGPAAIAFGAVVVLTMLAARAFDPRLLWDRPEKRHA
ncbi:MULTISPECIES: paraquat-inducible protein A [unclassified Achromobacter]|uniref:paraquat-inducible protein A n=1 Tax=unclassified Achromobacter TaxID=2626865 RepID=UPI000B517CE0|nr:MULTISPECIES: paraquat-inducible protein A [unclassified Achromobacter]OWT75531.1 paraquat-inducible membrane protein A [Achromobacter sp. HZ28]OWT76192.1 paraquat-inducible membrane protein A [Achromobacter sp. HZ34]